MQLLDKELNVKSTNKDITAKRPL